MAVKPIPTSTTASSRTCWWRGLRLVEFLKATFDAEDLGSMPTPEGKIGRTWRCASATRS